MNTLTLVGVKLSNKIKSNEMSVCQSQQRECELSPNSQEIARAQQADPNIQKLTKVTKYTTQLMEHTQVLCKGTVMVLPAALQHRAVSWHHRCLYLQHPGSTHLQDTLHAEMYWKGMCNTI